MPRPRVLLAEDHAVVAQQLRRLLETTYDVVRTVSDGASLLGAVDALSPAVVVSDIAMPRVSGLAAARIIRRRHPDVRIVFVTVSDDAALVRDALAAGVLGYVLKDDAGEELLLAVRAALEGRYHLSASVRGKGT